MRKLRLRLDEVLQEKNISQRKLSKLTGIYPNAIGNMCRNTGTSINKEYLSKIAEVLDIDDIRMLIHWE